LRKQNDTRQQIGNHLDVPQRGGAATVTTQPPFLSANLTLSIRRRNGPAAILHDNAERAVVSVVGGTFSPARMQSRSLLSGRGLGPTVVHHPLLNGVDLLAAAMRALVGLQFQFGPRRVRLKARKVHRTSAIADGKQEWIA
jgi:hypothetical protein